jgi:hypothetical protein
MDSFLAIRLVLIVLTCFWIARKHHRMKRDLAAYKAALDHANKRISALSQMVGSLDKCNAAQRATMAKQRSPLK